jgi:hypothetical protein
MIPTCCDIAVSSGEGDNLQRYVAAHGNIFRNNSGGRIIFMNWGTLFFCREKTRKKRGKRANCPSLLHPCGL